MRTVASRAYVWLAIAAGAAPACGSGAEDAPPLGYGSGGEGGSFGAGGSGASGSGGDGEGAWPQGGSGPGGASQGGSAQGGASQGGGTTTSTGTGGGGGGDDPCAGASDGGHCGSELGGTADHGSAYTCAGGATAQVTPCPHGCDGGTCKSPPADPCASAQSGDGSYCGGSLAGGDANALYQCQGGKTASKQDCPAGCQVQPPGVPDNCKPDGDPCQNANAGNGAYCGGSLGAGDPNTLYDCKNQQTASKTTCPAGCQSNPPGVPDACKSAGGGDCCVEHPPGVVTQSFSACGLGGSHYGIDYGTPIGTPIYAGISGTVAGSALGFPNCYDGGCSKDCWNAFNYVKIESDCGDPDDGGKDLYVYYLHIDSLAPGIGNGAHVDQGQHVANSGNSGCSSGPHIHIETVSVPKGANASLNTCSSVDPGSRYCP